jgi:hypothetical protein
MVADPRCGALTVIDVVALPNISAAVAVSAEFSDSVPAEIAAKVAGALPPG